MCSLIGFGRCTVFYFYILISTVTKFLKEDILGLGIDYQIILDIKIHPHPILILLLGFLSDFIISGIIVIYKYYKEEKNMDNVDISDINTISLFPKEDNNLIEGTQTKNVEEIIEPNPINEIKITKTVKSEDNYSSRNVRYGSKFFLIHNDIASMKIESLRQNAKKFILLSALLIVLKEFFIKIIYQSNDIFDYYFLNLIIMAIILRFIFKHQVFRHQIFAIILVSLISGSCLISCIFVSNGSNLADNKSASLNFRENYYMIIILILVYICISIAFCAGIIFQKNLIQINYISSPKILFWKGVFGVLFCIIGLAISSNVICDNGQIRMPPPPHEGGPPDPNQNPGGPPEPNQNPGGPPSELNQNISDLYKIFQCDDFYKNNSYFDNFFSYFESLSNPSPDQERKNDSNDDNNGSKIAGEIIILLVFFILHYFSEISLILVNSNLTPVHYLITECLYNVIHILYEIVTKIIIEKKGLPPHIEQKEALIDDSVTKNDTTRILKFVAVVFELLGYFIYMEIIHLNFCGLSNNTVKNIQKRAKQDFNNIEDTFSEGSEITNGE